MAKTIKKHKDVAFIVGVGLFLTIAGILAMSGMLVLPDSASAAETSTEVSVSATVEPWISISVGTSSTPLTPALVDSAGDGHIGSTTDITIDVGTNDSAGWTLNIKGDNDGLYKSAAPTSTIASVTATSSLSAESDGYGADATTSESGVTIDDYYNYWGNDVVGEIKTAGHTLSDKDTPNSSVTVTTIKVKAACTTDKPSGTYSDTITLTVTGKT